MTILRGPAPITTETTMNETAPAPKNELAEALTIIAEQPAPDTRIKIIIEPETLEFTAEEQKELDAMLSPASPPPSLKLGQIGERLGFTLTADFLLSLGFAPAATEKNSKLFHEADFPRICAALQRHIASVQAKFQPE
jgi:hypothetical protein